MLSAREAEQSLRVRLSGRAWGRRGAGDEGSQRWALWLLPKAGSATRPQAVGATREWQPREATSSSIF